MGNCLLITNLLPVWNWFNSPAIFKHCDWVTLTSNQKKTILGNWLMEVVWSFLGSPYTLFTQLAQVADPALSARGYCCYIINLFSLQPIWLSVNLWFNGLNASMWNLMKTTLCTVKFSFTIDGYLKYMFIYLKNKYSMEQDKITMIYLFHWEMLKNGQLRVVH